MKRDTPRPELLSLPSGQIEMALAHLEQSAAFRSSPRHRALLRHLVARMLDDDLATLKESVIAVEVFGRPVASFDPKFDTIVRVEARRLRMRLTSYYRDEGEAMPIRIELPVGSYVPLIANRQTEATAPEATRRARDLVERGEHFLRQALSKPTLLEALERFERALLESPDHAPALVGLGRTWLNLATGWHVEPAIASSHAGEALRRALALAPDSATAHALLGAIQHQFEHDWASAERSFRRALMLAPQQAFVHSAYGCHLYIHGAFDTSERELRLARQLDPQYLNARNHMVNLRIAQGRLDDAQAEILALQDIAPETVSIVGLRAAIAMFRRDPTTALRHYRRAVELQPDHPGCHVSLAGAHAMAGHTETADAMLAHTLERFGERLLSPCVLAMFETRRGRFDNAFALIERALRERDPHAMQTPIDPSFEDLHADPRWAALLAAKPFNLRR